MVREAEVSQVSARFTAKEQGHHTPTSLTNTHGLVRRISRLRPCLGVFGKRKQFDDERRIRSHAVGAVYGY
jgi:hypothetical protein